MVTLPINWIAVVVATFVHMVIGGLWFSPLLFGNQWVKLMGIKATAQQRKKEGGKAMAWMALASLIMSVILVHLMSFVSLSQGPLSALQGAFIGFLLWLGFLNTVKISGLLFHNQKFKLYLIETSYELVTVVAMAIVVTCWY